MNARNHRLALEHCTVVRCLMLFTSLPVVLILRLISMHSGLCVCEGVCEWSYGSESLSLSIRVRLKTNKALEHGQEASGPPKDVAVS